MVGPYIKKFKNSLWPYITGSIWFEMKQFKVNGSKLFLNPYDNSVSKKAFVRKRHEEYEAFLMRKIAERAFGVILDIGANIGIFTVLLAEASKNSTVYAFEPSVENLFYLHKNCRDRKNIQVVPTAVSESTSLLKLQLSEVNRGDHRIWGTEEGRSQLSMGVSLQDFFKTMQLDFKNLRVVKIDTQGCEPEILYSMNKNLSELQDCYFLTEYWLDGFNERKIDLKKYHSFVLQEFDEVYLLDYVKRKTIKVESLATFDLIGTELCTVVTLLLGKKSSLGQILKEINYV